MTTVLTLGLLIFGSFAVEAAEDENPIVHADDPAPIPVDCVGEFQNITNECSKPCGCGYVKQKYVIITEAKNGGNPCEKEEGTIGAAPCKIKNCPQTVWTECNATCGPGYQFKKWENEEDGEGLKLEEPLMKECQKQECCSVSEWSEWTGCPACGEGEETRTRTIVTEGYGCPEPEELTETQACKLSECPFRMEVIPNTTCSGEVLDLDVDPTTVDCLRACTNSDACEAVMEASGKCTFFSKLEEEIYTPGDASCYKTISEEPEETTDYMPLAMKGLATIAVLALGWVLIGAVSKSDGSVLPRTPFDTPPRQHADAPARTPAH